MIFERFTFFRKKSRDQEEYDRTQWILDEFQQLNQESKNRLEKARESLKDLEQDGALSALVADLEEVLETLKEEAGDKELVIVIGGKSRYISLMFLRSSSFAKERVIRLTSSQNKMSYLGYFSESFSLNDIENDQVQALDPTQHFIIGLDDHGVSFGKSNSFNTTFSDSGFECRFICLSSATEPTLDHVYSISTDPRVYSFLATIGKLYSEYIKLKYSQSSVFESVVQGFIFGNYSISSSQEEELLVQRMKILSQSRQLVESLRKQLVVRKQKMKLN